MKQNQKIVIGIILLISLGIIGVPVSAVSFHIDDAEFTTAGETITRDLVCDTLPQGLSGYNLSVSVDDPGVGNISAVLFPDWAAPRSATAVPASSIWIKAVDMTNAVWPGDQNIVFAHILVKANAPGVTSFSNTPVALDDDAGNPIMTTAYIAPAATQAPQVKATTQVIGTTPGVTRQTLSPVNMTANPAGSATIRSPATRIVYVNGTPQVIYVNATPEIIYVTVTRKSPSSPLLVIIVIAFVGIGVAGLRRKGR